MPNDEEIKYLMNYYIDSLNQGVSLAILQKIDHFISLMKKETLNDALNNDYVLFLKRIYPKMPDNIPEELTNLTNLDKYHLLYERLIDILNGDFAFKTLAKIDTLWLDDNLTYYLNLDEKEERILEDKIYKKLKTDNIGFSYLNKTLKQKLKISPTICIFLVLDFLKNNKHPAQIVTINNHNESEDNVNLDFENYVNNEDYLLYLYKESFLFILMYHNNAYIYEKQLKEILKDVKIPSPETLFYVDFTAYISSLLTLTKLYKVNGIDSSLLKEKETFLTKQYYGLLEGVRTINPFDNLYDVLEKKVTEEKITQSKKDIIISGLRKNRYEQIAHKSLYGNYILTKEELQKIFLIIVLSYAKGKTYSNFNRDVIKDFITYDLTKLFAKYQKIEYQNGLQKLYMQINAEILYTEEVIENSLRSLPIDYYLLAKINELTKGLESKMEI